MNNGIKSKDVVLGITGQTMFNRTTPILVLNPRCVDKSGELWNGKSYANFQEKR